MKKYFSLSIRTKLLLASLSLLLVPWLGYHYIQDLESFLRSEQEQRGLNRAAMLAAVMGEHAEQFSSNTAINNVAHDAGQHLYVRPLKYPIQLDGYLEDWEYYPERVKTFSHKKDPDDLTIDYRFGTYDKYLYLVLEIKDDHLVYRQPNSLRLDKSDHLRLGIRDKKGRFSHYWISTSAPGWVNAQRMPNNSKSALAIASEFAIKGEWQETKAGYTIEIRLPTSMIGNQFSFAFADVDNSDTRKIETLVGTGDTSRVTGLSSIVIPSAKIASLLKRLKTAGERIWIVDSGHRVLALAGDIQGLENASSYQMGEQNQSEPPAFSQFMRVMFRLILEQSLGEFNDELSAVSRLDDPSIVQALRGKGAARWRQTQNERVNVLTVAQPVYADNQVIGVVAIESTSNSILILQNRALEILISLSVVAFFVTVFVLLAFATRLSMRVRRLRNEADNAIASDGRVQGQIKRSNSGDELGDLNRSFASMVDRLSHYNRYLETMASKLAHELRTPISVVRSSLDNLDIAQSEAEAETYKQRAREGIDRLSGILTRMSEATRLEQTLQQEEIEIFDLVQVVRGCLAGYRLAHSSQVFELKRADKAPMKLTGSPELIAQMLDKLINNAKDFSAQDKPIVIYLSQTRHKIILKILNEGPTLPDDMQGNLFDSMVSVRSEKTAEPHLGLGLYIVRLIVEFHGGEVCANNRHDVCGVEFCISLPKS